MTTVTNFSKTSIALILKRLFFFDHCERLLRGFAVFVFPLAAIL